MDAICSIKKPRTDFGSGSWTSTMPPQANIIGGVSETSEPLREKSSDAQIADLLPKRVTLYLEGSLLRN